MHITERVKILSLVLSSIFLLAFSNTAQAESDASNKWQFELTPYLWLPTTSGTSTVDGTDTDIHAPFKDVLDNFDVIGLMGRFEAYKGDWLLVFDGMYMDIKGDFVIVTQDPSLPPLNIQPETKLTILDFGAGYKIYEDSLGKQQDTPRMPLIRLYAMTGVRYAYLKQELTIHTIPPTVPTVNGDSKNWVEPFIGARFDWQTSEKLTFLLRGDIGGFGVGSDLTWNALAGLDYRPWKVASFKIGYRALGIDYETGSGDDRFGLDAIMYGPIIGVTFHF
jgi:hypothetical protein